MEAPLFVVTAWRDAGELLQLRRNLCWRVGDEGEDRREKAVNKVHAWKARKLELPLFLESTVDIVDAILQDEKGVLPHSALRLAYATAVARFVTGFTDTQLDLKRSRPEWLPTDPSTPFLDFPPTLLETRHSIVHRQFPSLAELKKAANQGLDWLWEWYWSRLDVALAPTYAKNEAGTVEEGEGRTLSSQELKERFQAVLKSYLKSRKAELKSGVKQAKKESRVAGIATSTVSEICALNSSYHSIPLKLLVDEKTIIPADREIGDSMAGAFLLWSPLLIKLSNFVQGFHQGLVGRLLVSLNNNYQPEPVREAMLEWLVHIVTSDPWKEAREHPARSVERILEQIFTEPTFWNLRLAEALIQCGGTPNREQWKLILNAAKNEDMEMEIDDPNLATGEREEQNEAAESREQAFGPQRVLGLWRPKPIGEMPVGWEDDE